MQVGHSIFQAPPAIPAPTINNINSSIGMLAPPPHYDAPSFMSMPPGYPGGSSSNAFNVASKISLKLHQKNLKSLLPAVERVPPTISGFNKLKTLTILDMDTLDYASEIKTCIRNCSPTLNTLKLSFSETLARKSRQPPPEVHSDDDESDQDDEFAQLIPPPGAPPGPPTSGAADQNGASKVLKAQEEKKKQEAVLGEIFGLATVVTKPQISPPEIEIEPETTSSEDYGSIFARNLVPVAKKLFSIAEDSDNLGPKATEVLDLITKAAKLYLENLKKSQSGEKPSLTGSAGSTTTKATPDSSSALMSGAAEPGLFDNPKTKGKGPRADSEVSNPDDINVDEPEGNELATDNESTMTETQTDATEDLQPEKTDTAPSHSSMDSVINQMRIIEQNLESVPVDDEAVKQFERLMKQMEALTAELDLTELKTAYTSYRRRTDKAFRNLKEHIHRVLDDKTVPAADVVAKMSDYVLSTRGLTLTTLAIYLIPVKASVLSRAIDITVLQSITLLNVGPQIPFWTIMAHENKLSPLPLRKIHTDNVTKSFLVFVTQLDAVTELLLLERTQKARVESAVEKTNVTMENIRRALKKHAATLKVLMIRNDSGSEWDLNVKTAILLCERAQSLEELACSFGIRTMVSLSRLLSPS